MVLPQDDEWLDEDEDYETQELWDKRLARAGENLEEFRELENEEDEEEQRAWMQHADSQAEATSKCSLACCNAYFPSFVVSMLTVLPAWIFSAVLSCNGQTGCMLRPALWDMSHDPAFKSYRPGSWIEDTTAGSVGSADDHANIRDMNIGDYTAPTYFNAIWAPQQSSLYQFYGIKVSADMGPVSFVFWTMEIIITLCVLIYHLSVAHHPKFYTTLLNRISIFCHMLGGTVGIVGLWAGVWNDSKALIVVATLFGFCLHLPSVYWQLRQVHGQREIIIPAYVCIWGVLVVKYFDVFYTDFAAAQVIALGHTLNIFCWVRAFGWVQKLSDMEYEASHDRALFAAGFVKAPFVFGLFGGFGIALSVFGWNIIFKNMPPYPRVLLRVNRGYNTVFSKRLELEAGCKFQWVLTKHLARQRDPTYPGEPDEPLAVAKAAFEMCARINEDPEEKLAGVFSTKGIRVKELIYLYKSWGIVDAVGTAQDQFKKADKDGSGFLEFEEFNSSLKFIWESIYRKGNMQTNVAVILSSFEDEAVAVQNPMSDLVVVEELATPENPYDLAQALSPKRNVQGNLGKFSQAERTRASAHTHADSSQSALRRGNFKDADAVDKFVKKAPVLSTAALAQGGVNIRKARGQGVDSNAVLNQTDWEVDKNEVERHGTDDEKVFEEWATTVDMPTGWRKYFPTLQVSVLSLLPWLLISIFFRCDGTYGCKARIWECTPGRAMHPEHMLFGCHYEGSAYSSSKGGLWCKDEWCYERRTAYTFNVSSATGRYNQTGSPHEVPWREARSRVQEVRNRNFRQVWKSKADFKKNTCQFYDTGCDVYLSSFCTSQEKEKTSNRSCLSDKTPQQQVIRHLSDTSFPDTPCTCPLGEPHQVDRDCWACVPGMRQNHEEETISYVKTRNTGEWKNTVGQWFWFGEWAETGGLFKSREPPYMEFYFPSDTGYLNGTELHRYISLGTSGHEKEKNHEKYHEARSGTSWITLRGHLTDWDRRFSFFAWGIEVFCSLCVVAYHIYAPNHPKFYATRKNQVSIRCHMVGGTFGIVLPLVGAVLNQKPVILLGMLFGMFLHLPSVWWQLRSVHGHREIIVPAYVLIFGVLVIKYFDVLTTDFSPQAVMALGHTMNIFAWVRLFGYMQVMGDMEYDQSHDRALTAAGFVKAPFIFGMFGALIIVSGICVWNYIFSLLKPFPRELLRVNRGYNTVFSKRFERRVGVTFEEVLGKYMKQTVVASGFVTDDSVPLGKGKVEKTDEVLAVAKAAFEMCVRVSHDDNELPLDHVFTGGVGPAELAYLFKSWGLPDGDAAADHIFERSDEDESGFIEFKEFVAHLGFVFNSIFVKGNNKMKIKTVEKEAVQAVHKDEGLEGLESGD